MIKRGKRKGWKAKYHLALLHTVITRGPKRLSETRGRGKQEAAQKGLMCNPVGHQAPAASLSWSLGSICHPQATYQLSPPTSTFKTSQGRPGPATRYPPSSPTSCPCWPSRLSSTASCRAAAARWLHRSYPHLLRGEGAEGLGAAPSSLSPWLSSSEAKSTS